MQYRELGRTGWQVSAISLGCWGIGGQWGPVEEDTALAVLRRAFELGVNLYDTADAYGLGRSEELVGQAFAKSDRESIFIATKVGNWARRLDHPLSYAIPEHITLCCDASLHRLKTDYIDLYQCHIGGLEEPSVFLEAFEKLKQGGKIRAYGISTDSIAALKRFDRDGTCETLQLAYNVIGRGAETELFPYCREKRIGTLIRNPLGMGVLAGKFSPETRFDDVRSGWNEGKGRENFLRNLEKVESLRFLQGDNRTLAQAALQWILTNPDVSCAIPGAKNLDQLEANIRAADTQLTPEEVQQIQNTVA